MKKLLFIVVAFLVVGLLYFNSIKESEIEKERKQYAEFRKEHPYNKSMYLPKKERKSLGLPPNAYFEQEYLNEINPNTGRTHPENVFELQKKLNSEKNLRRTPGDEANNPWVERGPNNIGGRTRALLFDPNDITHKRVFAGGVSGGLWVNNDITDTNSSWQQVGISENLAITCISVDPNDQQIMYVGTGESYTSDNGVGNGVWKSIDGGNNWVNIFNDTDFSTGSSIFFVNTILAWNNPNTNSTEVFIGIGGAYYSSGSQFNGSIEAGIYKSIDNGVNWSKISLDTPNNTPYEPNDFEIGADNTIWVGTERNNYGHGGGTILKSIDGINFTVGHTISDGARTEIAVSKTDKDKIYVLASGSSTPVILLKTDNAFSTAPADLSLPNDVDTGIPANDFTRGQAFYDLVVEIDPTNDEVLYVGGIDLFRSTDSGTSWEQISKWHSGNTQQAYFLDSNLPVPIVHADQHGFVFHPGNSNKAIIGNDGGVYYASSLSDAVESTSVPNTSISSRNKDYNTLQFYNGAIGQNTTTDILIAGAQDNGTQFIDGAYNNSSNPSFDVYGGDGAYTFIDKDGDYMIVSYVYNVKGLLNLPYTGNGKELDEDQNTGSFINPQDLDDNLNILYANAHNNETSTYEIRRYKGVKTDEVLEIENITNGLLDTSATVVKVSPFGETSTTLFLGLSDGRLLKVVYANFQNPIWTDISSGSGFIGAISSIEFGNNENEIFVTFHNYGVVSVWYTSNGGVSWQNKEGDLPDIPTKTIMMNPLNNNQVIIGSELGVWATSNFNDESPKWAQSNNGMSNVKVTSLSLRKGDNTVLATTYGRGMFTGKFTAAAASVKDILTDKKPFTIYPTISNGNFTVFAKNTFGKTKVNIFDINGKQVYESNLDFNTNDKQEVSVNLNNGIYMVNLTDENNKKSSSKIIIK